MTKKAYMKPTMNLVKIQQRASILGASEYGMNSKLQGEEQGEEVSNAWSRRGNSVWDDDEE